MILLLNICNYLYPPITSTRIVTFMTPCSLDAMQVYWPTSVCCTPLKRRTPSTSCTWDGNDASPPRDHFNFGGILPSARQIIREFEPNSNLVFVGTGLNLSRSIHKRKSNVKCGNWIKQRNLRNSEKLKRHRTWMIHKTKMLTVIYFWN